MPRALDGRSQPVQARQEVAEYCKSGDLLAQLSGPMREFAEACAHVSGEDEERSQSILEEAQRKILKL